MPVPELPTREAFSSALRVSESSIPAAQYLASQLRTVLEKGKLLDVGSDLLAEVERHAKYVKFNLSQLSNSWSGQAPITEPDKNLHGHLAREAVESIPANDRAVRSIAFQYAVADNKACLAVFTEGGQPLEGEENQLFNELFTTWLVKNDLSSKGGFLYKKDASGKDVPVTAEQFNALIEDPVRGFGAGQGFGDELAKKGFALECIERAYPGVTQKVEQERRVEPERPAQTSGPDVNPEQPQPDETYTPG